MTTRALLVLLLVALAPISVALAADADGSEPMTCAITEVLECDEASGCTERLPQELNLPDFFLMDIETMTIREVGEGESLRETQIRHHESVDASLLMYGGEEGRAWSLVMNQESGELSGGISGDGFTLVLFGSCMVE